jgi:hypothetical protein
MNRHLRAIALSEVTLPRLTAVAPVWRCIEEIEADMGERLSLESVRDEFGAGYALVDRSGN